MSKATNSACSNKRNAVNKNEQQQIQGDLLVDGIAGTQTTKIKQKKSKINIAMESQLKNVTNTTAAAAADVPKIAVNISRRSAGSNWNAHQQATNNDETNASADEEETQTSEENGAPTLSKSARLRQRRKANQLNRYVAIDCEMVGVGLKGQDDMLARVSIVNKRGDVLLDEFVKPQDIVTDYRTCVSGIRPADIVNAQEFPLIQDKVIELLQGKILIGHAIRNDLAVLRIKHPFCNIRDTSRYKPLCRLVSNGRTPSLKRVVHALFGVDIQTGEHNSVEDARAAMKIYNHLAGDWEQSIRKNDKETNKKSRKYT